VQPGQHADGHFGNPVGDRGKRAHTRHHRCRAQGKYDRHRVINPAGLARIVDLRESID
jgi:hypothetical protein